jgi:hypothetical protein
VGPGDETITQIPVLIENSSSFGPIRVGGGIGYDFVSYPQSNGSSAASGVMGETFAQIGFASNTALEAKYLFSPRAALGGVFVGISTRL